MSQSKNGEGDSISNVRSTKIRHFVQLTYFDLASSQHRIGAALHPGDCFVHVLDFPEPETGDQPARVGERPVDNRTAGTIERNTLAPRRGRKAVTSLSNLDTTPLDERSFVYRITSKVTSILTGVLSGRLTTPTTERTDSLSTPKTSRKSSEAPSATFG